MSEDSNVDYKSAIRTFMSCQFPEDTLNAESVKLVAKLLNELNKELLAKFRDNKKSGSDAGDVYLRSAQTAVEKVFEGDMQPTALANSNRQLMLLESGLTKYIPKKKSGPPAIEAARKGVTAGIKKSIRGGPEGGGFTMAKDAEEFLSTRIANLLDFIASRAAEDTQDMGEVTPVDIQKVLDDYVTGNLQKAMNAEGARLLLLNTSGMIKFQPESAMAPAKKTTPKRGAKTGKKSSSPTSKVAKGKEKKAKSKETPQKRKSSSKKSVKTEPKQMKRKRATTPAKSKVSTTSPAPKQPKVSTTKQTKPKSKVMSAKGKGPSKKSESKGTKLKTSSTIARKGKAGPSKSTEIIALADLSKEPVTKKAKRKTSKTKSESASPSPKKTKPSLPLQKSSSKRKKLLSRTKSGSVSPAQKKTKSSSPPKKTTSTRKKTPSRTKSGSQKKKTKTSPSQKAVASKQKKVPSRTKSGSVSPAQKKTKSSSSPQKTTSKRKRTPSRTKSGPQKKKPKTSPSQQGVASKQKKVPSRTKTGSVSHVQVKPKMSPSQKTVASKRQKTKPKKTSSGGKGKKPKGPKEKSKSPKRKIAGKGAKRKGAPDQEDEETEKKQKAVELDFTRGINEACKVFTELNVSIKRDANKKISTIVADICHRLVAMSVELAGSQDELTAEHIERVTGDLLPGVLAQHAILSYNNKPLCSHKKSTK